MRVLFTPTAERDFLASLEYVRSKNPAAARAFHDRLRESLGRLRDFPESGRHIPEFPNLPHRELIVAPYRFFYRIKGVVIWIVGVWHDAQLPTEPDE